MSVCDSATDGRAFDRSYRIRRSVECAQCAAPPQH